MTPRNPPMTNSAITASGTGGVQPLLSTISRWCWRATAARRPRRRPGGPPARPLGHVRRRLTCWPPGYDAAMGALGTPLLAVLFLAAAAATWAAGVSLSRSTGALDGRLGLGDAIGGLVFLAVAGSLPELAITVSAALAGHIALASGNLIGGIATQTLVLVLCDAFVRGERPLTFMVGSLLPVLEALLVVIVVTVTVAGGLLPASIAIGPVSPASIAIVVLWVGGLVVVNKARKDLRWRADAPESHPGRRRKDIHRQPTAPFAGRSTAAVVVVFAGASAVTLGAGVVLAVTGNALADRAGINGLVFGP